MGLILALFSFRLASGAPLLLRVLDGRRVIIGSSLVAAVLYVVMYLVGFESIGAIMGFVFATGLTLGCSSWCRRP